jgi:DNA-binding CsgD family transcriptional regulator
MNRLKVAARPAPRWRPTHGSMEAIAKHYKLTPRELRVLRAVMEIGGVPEIADALGVSRATVRSHLHQVFQKTGAKRQIDLVKLVAGADRGSAE